MKAGVALPQGAPAEIFFQLARCVQAYAGMSYENLGDCGRLIAEFN
jgi:predicted molibdopterin-dependent oxidoreductase YjgC